MGTWVHRKAGAWCYGWHLLHPSQPGSHSQYPHFTARKTEAQRGKGTCLQSHSWKVAELGLNLSHLCSLAWKPSPETLRLQSSDSGRTRGLCKGSMTQTWDKGGRGSLRRTWADQTRPDQGFLYPTPPSLRRAQATDGHWAYTHGQADLSITCPSIIKEVPL